MHTETLIAPSRAVRRSRTNSWLAIAWLTGLAICAQAHADEKLELLGGPGGGAFEAHCPAGQLLVGLELRAADDVDAIRPLCATANGPRDAGDGTAEQTWYGGDGGRPVSLVCPKYTPIVTGMYVRTDGKDTLIVNNIHLFCGVAAAVPESNHAPGASFDAPDYDGGGTILHFPGYEVDCLSGQVGVGVYGKSGIWLDSVSLICGAPTVASAPMPGNVVTSIGRMPTSSPSGPLISLCQRAKDARARNSPAASNLEAQCNASKKASNVVDKVVIEPPSAPAPAYLYSIDHDGKLRWYHQDGVKNDPSDWQGPRVVDKHWDDFKQVFAGGDGIIYAITKKGSLMRYRHAGFATGSGKNDPGSWQAPQQLASGWGDYTQAFSVGHGVIYAIARDGTLQWFRHTGF